jgi:hypothetical protein
MTMNESRPNPPRYTEPRRPNNSNMMWLGGLLALALLVGGIFWATSNRSTVANRPASTTGATTTTTVPRTEPVQPTNPAGNSPTAPSPVNR